MKNETESGTGKKADTSKSEEIGKKRLPIAEWPEIERKMAIISRMTSDRH